jgi:hypothetical protein
MKPHIFTIPVAPFKQDMVVMVGVTCKQFFAWNKKNGFVTFDEDKEDIEELFEDHKTSNGFTVFDPGKPMLLWLADYSYKNWAMMETLIHELHHAVFLVSNHYGTEKELEFQAHLQINLFERIRIELARKIDTDNKKAKKKRKKKV